MRFSIVLSMLKILANKKWRNNLYANKEKNPWRMNDTGSCFNEMVTNAMILHPGDDSNRTNFIRSQASDTSIANAGFEWGGSSIVQQFPNVRKIDCQQNTRNCWQKTRYFV